MTTLERRMYAVKRIATLTHTLTRLNNLIALRSHSGKPEDRETRKHLMKDRRSIKTALKRWEKMI